MCKVYEEHLKVKLTVLSLLHKFTCDCLIAVSFTKCAWDKWWNNCSWRRQLELNLHHFWSTKTKHHLDQREAWEPRKYCCEARRKGAEYNTHQKDWCRKLYLYSKQWLWWTREPNSLCECYMWVCIEENYE